MNPPDDDFLRLLAQAQAGDAAAKDALFAQCRSFLSQIAQAELAGDLLRKVDASDLVQETLLEANRGLEHFRGQTAEEWHAWLRRIVRHNAVDLGRHYQGAAKRQVSREHSFSSSAGDDASNAGWEPAGDQSTPSQQAMRSEATLHTLSLLSQLPEDYQQVLRLRSLESLPFDEVAARMGRSRPATQMLWTRAVRRLRELMGPEDASSASPQQRPGLSELPPPGEPGN